MSCTMQSMDPELTPKEKDECDLVEAAAKYADRMRDYAYYSWSGFGGPPCELLIGHRAWLARFDEALASLLARQS